VRVDEIHDGMKSGSCNCEAFIHSMKKKQRKVTEGTLRILPSKFVIEFATGGRNMQKNKSQQHLHARHDVR